MRQVVYRGATPHNRLPNTLHKIGRGNMQRIKAMEQDAVLRSQTYYSSASND